MNELQPDQFSFGRHETFPLRFGWLTKGYQAWCDNNSLFEADEATMVLGVGKNMVNAIRYWMIAAQLVENTGKGLYPTQIGKAIFSTDGFDPYLEDEATIWLLHWLLASNPKDATAIFWFFNRFHKSEFTSQELLSGLTGFVGDKLNSRVSSTTLKHDATVLLRMYELTAETKAAPLEEGLDSPLAQLRLIRAAAHLSHQSMPDVRNSLPPDIVGFAIAEVFALTKQPSIPVSTLMHSNGYVAAPGAVFRLTEEALLAKIERFAQKYPGCFRIEETAGLHQVFQLERLSPLDILTNYYQKPSLERAA